MMGKEMRVALACAFSRFPETEVATAVRRVFGLDFGFMVLFPAHSITKGDHCRTYVAAIDTRTSNPAPLPPVLRSRASSPIVCG